MSAYLELPTLGEPLDSLWESLLDLADRLEIEWTIIGGLMVLLHALEHQTVPPVVTQDADLVANIRATQSALRQVVHVLSTLGFEQAGMAATGIAHRYVRAAHTSTSRVIIDVLAPEGVGDNTDLTTTKPGRTIEVEGGTQALARTESVGVRFAARIGRLPRPNLLGAIIIKAAACNLPEDVTRHARDLAFLCSLVDDPFALRLEMSSKDRQRLQRVHSLDDAHQSAWRQLADEQRRSASSTWEILRSPIL